MDDLIYKVAALLMISTVIVVTAILTTGGWQ